MKLGIIYLQENQLSMNQSSTNQSLNNQLSINKLPPLYLKKNEDRRALNGHPWIYSNEIDVTRSPLKNFEAGTLVCVLNDTNKPIGSAYINPHSLICARVYSRLANVVLNQDLIEQRLRDALALRAEFYPTNHYRLCFSEGDFLPGLIIDRFDDVAVVMITTAGMERFKDEIINALKAVLNIDKIILRNDSRFRELENLSSYVENIGDVPENLLISEDNMNFCVPSKDGQKSGWFYDQRDNRDKIMPHLKGKRVLDLFSYMGAWGLRALKAGASDVTCVDISAHALATLEKNAALNNIDDNLELIEGDAFTVLRALANDNKKYDVIIVDPPAFIKRKKDFKQGFDGYKRINQLALALLNPNGLLISLSCSQHLSVDNLNDMLVKAAAGAKVSLQQLQVLTQGADHPVLPMMPENFYLKGVMLRVNSLE